MLEIKATTPDVASLNITIHPGSRVMMHLVSAVYGGCRKIRPEMFVFHRKALYLLVSEELFVQQPLSHGLKAFIGGLWELDFALALELLSQLGVLNFSFTQPILDNLSRSERVDISRQV
jgi:hypothetical protein